MDIDNKVSTDNTAVTDTVSKILGEGTVSKILGEGTVSKILGEGTVSKILRKKRSREKP